MIRPLIRICLILSTLLSVACQNQADNTDRAPQSTHTVAFGSCLRQWQPQTVWSAVSALHPDAFVFLGDNVYSDIGPYEKQQEPQRIWQAYQDLLTTDAYQRFLQSAAADNTQLYATWDDHDYGRNDGGADYPYKLQSKKYFMEFFLLKKTATGNEQPGVYHSEYLNLGGLRVQLLLLDTRSFRSKLIYRPTTANCPSVNIAAYDDPSATILGDGQWQWLEGELKQPADIRILASSIEVLPFEHCYEKWSNFPLERSRLLKLLESTRANGVIIISGDRHLAEISRLPASTISYPLYEITSSGLNSAMGPDSQGAAEKNSLRVTAENVLVNNFGTIEINRRDSGTELNLQIRDETGGVQQQETVLLNTLQQ